MVKSGTGVMFNWEEYFNLAKELSGDSSKRANNDSKLRSSVSRSYFAVFCIVRNHLRDKGKILAPDSRFPNYYPHWFVIEKLVKNSDKSKRRIGHNLKRLRNNRNLTDYEDKLKSNLQSLTLLSIALAEKILTELTEI